MIVLRLFQSCRRLGESSDWLTSIFTPGTGQEGSSASHKACEKPLSGESWGVKSRGVKQLEIGAWISRICLSGICSFPSVKPIFRNSINQDLQHPVCKKSLVLMLCVTLISLTFYTKGESELNNRQDEK